MRPGRLARFVPGRARRARSRGFLSGGFRKASSVPWRNHGGFPARSSPSARKAAGANVLPGTAVVSVLVVQLLFGSPLLPAAEGRLDLPGGYRQEVLLELDPSVTFELQLGGLCYGPAGEPIVYESGRVRILTGGEWVVLAEFDPPVSGSFLALSPDGRAVIFGENSVGNIFEVPLDGSGPVFAGLLPGNHDLAVAPEGIAEPLRGLAFVSAPGSGENGIHALALDGTPPDEIATVPGFSGPLTFDDEGNLYYVTSVFEPDLPALVRFRPEQLLAGLGEGVVGFGDAETLLSDIDGGFNLKWARGKLYLTDLGFSSGQGAIEVVDTRRNFLQEDFAPIPSSNGLISPTFLVVRPGEANFDPGVGPRGGRLLVAYSDFSSLSHVVEVTPELFFLRGDANGDERVDISDGVHLLAHLFRGGAPPTAEEAADFNGDGGLDLSDPIFLFEFLFRGGPRPPPPFPEPGPAPL